MSNPQLAREGHARQSPGERYGPLVLEGRPLLPERLMPEGQDSSRAHRTLQSGLALSADGSVRQDFELGSR